MAILINGNLNDPVYASQDSDLLAAIVGNTTCITQVGYQFAHELEDANTVMVKDGVIITKEGRRIQLDAGDVDEFLIPTGTQGVTAYYICGYHLYTDGESAELCETFVTLMGSSSETIPENTFRAGATEVYVSLLRVTQLGVNITAVTDLLPSSNTIKQIMTSISNINTSLSEKVNTEDIVNNLTSTSTTKPLSAAQGKELQDKKLPKAGGTMTGRLTLDSGTNDTPEVYFKTKDYGYAFFDKLNNNVRLYGSNDLRVYFSPGSIIVGDNSYNIKKHRQVQYNVAWKDCPNGASGSYLYEDTNGISTYDLPTTYCMVDVYKANSTRGVAIAYQWNNQGRGVWINRLHDSWLGWKPINGALNKIAASGGTYSPGAEVTIYYEQHNNVVTISGNILMGTSVSSDLNNAMYTLPSSIKPKYHVPFVMVAGVGTTQYKCVVDTAGGMFPRQTIPVNSNYQFSFSYIVC